MTNLVVSSLSKLLDPEWNALFDPFFSDSSLPFFFILLTYKTLSDHQPVTQRLYFFFHFIWAKVSVQNYSVPLTNTVWDPALNVEWTFQIILF